MRFCRLATLLTPYPPDVANAAAWLRTLFVSNTTNFYSAQKF
jgi:hypothetical protein